MHLQGYIEFKNTCRMSKLQLLFGAKNHFEKRKGTRTQARDYCMKEESRAAGTHPLEIGEWEPEKGKGKRTDLDNACEIVKEGGLKRAIEETPGIFVKYPKGLEALNNFHASKKTTSFRKVEVVVLWGPTGTGKTRHVWETEEGEDVYC